MLINKDTKIFCSFSSSPGNNGCNYFNKRFQEDGINAIYKSFYSDDICKSIEAVKTLDIKGFAVSMPFKSKVLDYVDNIDEISQIIGAANTVTNVNGILTAYNTDWLGFSKYVLESIDFLTILGNGCFSKAIQYACNKKNIQYQIITRKDWDKVYDLEGYVFNATPVDVDTKAHLIDSRPFTIQGKIIAKLQAEEQYKIYTNIWDQNTL
jgi:shikimate dehydrogenase